MVVLDAAEGTYRLVPCPEAFALEYSPGQRRLHALLPQPPTSIKLPVETLDSRRSAQLDLVRGTPMPRIPWPAGCGLSLVHGGTLLLAGNLLLGLREAVA